MRIDLLTLFPDMCETVMAESIVGRARKKGALQVCCHQIRNYAYDKHSRVDDCPFGGGMGMLLMAEPIAECIDDLVRHLGKKPHLVYITAGYRFDAEKDEGAGRTRESRDSVRPL